MNKHADILRRWANGGYVGYETTIADLLAAANEIERLSKIEEKQKATAAALSKINNVTCIHHTDSERANMKCPICLAAEIERLEAENAKLRGAQ